jgi:hypothetical protein
MAVLHLVGMKHRGLASTSENACTQSSERLSFGRAVVQGCRNSRLENVEVSFVFCIVAMHCYVTSLNLSRIASFKRS